MGGSEASQEHEPTTPQSTPSPTTPLYTPNGRQDGEFMAKTGEIMLGFALAIIIVVVSCIAVHVFLQDRKRRARKKGAKKNKKDKDIESNTSFSELHSVEKKVFETEGTEVVLYELPEDAPPVHEMEGTVVLPPLERTMTNMTSTSDMSSTTGMTGTTTTEIEFNPDTISPEDPWPEGRQLAFYWSTR